MPRVLVSDTLSEQGLAILRQGKGLTIDYKPVSAVFHILDFRCVKAPLHRDQWQALGERVVDSKPHLSGDHEDQPSGLGIYLVLEFYRAVRATPL